MITTDSKLLTQENKAKFFALYWGQNAIRDLDNQSNIFDFLRDKTYAIQFKSITVEQYVNAGWAVIKND